MKFMRVVRCSVNGGQMPQLWRSEMLRNFSTFSSPGNDTKDNQSTKSFESADDFEQRIFGDFPGNNQNSGAFYQKLDKLMSARDKYSFGSTLNGGYKSESLDGLDESFNTLSDGMDGKLKKAATYFEFNPEEFTQDNYSFRPDVTFKDRMTYDTKDLDLTKPGIHKFPKRHEFEVTTEEVLRKADFRNVRFLANFITGAGIIIKRSQTKISAKAQRKVAREIKTARAFGLMPFTTMGTKHFVFGKSMENLDEDFEYEGYKSRMGIHADEDEDPLGP